MSFARGSLGGAECDREPRPAAVTTREDVQFAANLFHEQQYDFHSKPFAIRGIEPCR
jgi:hypothetical protein